jgi:drug/metabolite transporter (DMT)-like permease
LLFAGNMCAVLALLAVFRKHWSVENLRRPTRNDWLSLIVLALLTSALAPWFFFIALENAMITSVVLLAQIEPPLVLVLSWLVFGERFGFLSATGAALCVVGVALSVLLQPSEAGIMIGKGEIFAALAAAIYAISTIIARPRLNRIPLGIFTVFRNAVGAMFFFIAVTYLYGLEHFADVTSPFLWQWMLVYGGVIIVGGQVFWFTGLKTARSIDVSLATSASPVAGVLAAYLILGERPLAAQLIGGGVLLLGIAIGLAGGRRRKGEGVQEVIEPIDKTRSALEAECKTGFKGV